MPDPDPGEDIRGRVETPDRRPVATASVAISDGSTHPDMAAVTDEDGHFVLPAGPPGRYAITVHKAGYPAQTVQVDTKAGGVVTVVLRRG